MATLTPIPTVRGAYRLIEPIGRGTTNWPASWNWHLGTASLTLDKTITTMVQVDQPIGGGYSSSGYAVSQNVTDFPTWDWFDGVSQVGSFTGGYLITKQFSDLTVTADLDFRYWVLADNNVTVNSRETWLIGDAGSTQTIPSGRTLFIDVEIRVTVNSPWGLEVIMKYWIV